VVEKQSPQPVAAEPEQGVVDLEQESAEERVPLGNLKTRAEFEEFVVWGHEAMADATSDPYMRIEEWTQLAEQVCTPRAHDACGIVLTCSRYITTRPLGRAHESDRSGSCPGLRCLAF